MKEEQSRDTHKKAEARKQQIAGLMQNLDIEAYVPVNRNDLLLDHVSLSEDEIGKITTEGNTTPGVRTETVSKPPTIIADTRGTPTPKVRTATASKV